MRITPANAKQSQQGAIIPYLMVLILLTTSIAGVAAYVSQTLNFAQRRNDMIAARQFSEGGVAVAALDLNYALTATNGTLASHLTGYTSSSTSSNTVYARSITTPFSNQTVFAQIWMANGSSPQKVVATAVVGQVSQTATLHLTMKFGAGGAIISTSDGSTATGLSKGDAQDGNVVINGMSGGKTIVDGGHGKAILANGRANIDVTYASIPASAISMNTGGTSNEIPDYTNPGSANQLFDFNRFIAVADQTTGGAGYLGSNHFTNMTTFRNAMNAIPAGQFMEGVIVVNLKKSEMGTAIDDSTDPTKGFLRGINVKGTLVFNFASDVSSTDKIFDTATLNINPADLSHLVATDSTTYTSGYPSLSTANTKNAINIDISHVTSPTTGQPFANFTAADDLPAMMYNIGILDMHGPVNISGVVYSPSFFEIENKQANIQYFKGALIGGNGIFFSTEHSGAASIVSYDSGALDQLATAGNNGKSLFATYWE